MRNQGLRVRCSAARRDRALAVSGSFIDSAIAAMSGMPPGPPPGAPPAPCILAASAIMESICSADMFFIIAAAVEAISGVSLGMPAGIPADMAAIWSSDRLANCSRMREAACGSLRICSRSASTSLDVRPAAPPPPLPPPPLPAPPRGGATASSGGGPSSSSSSSSPSPSATVTPASLAAATASASEPEMSGSEGDKDTALRRSWTADACAPAADRACPRRK